MKKPELKELTLREKIGQTVIFHLNNLKKIENQREYFKNNPVGSFWVSSETKEVYKEIETKLGNPELLGKKEDMFINCMNYVNECIRIPVMPAIDAAQGIPENKFENHAALPTAGGLGATRSPELSYKYAKALGDDILATGFNWIWSPVADNAGHYMDLRQLSSDTENNISLLKEFIKGMQAAGVATGAKHFPGVDPYDTRDTHYCTASYTPSFEEWERTQGREFMACIEAGVDSIMLGHVTFKAVDDTLVNGSLLPCSLSYKVITELIKGKLGFEGVCLSDDSNMKAFKAIYPGEKSYIECLKAGMDMIIAPAHLNYIDIVEEAVLSGELSEERIDDACQRVLNLKEKYGLFEKKEIPHVSDERRKEIADNIHKVSREIAENGLTLVANKTGFVPVNKEKVKKVKIVYIGYSEMCRKKIEKYMTDEFEKYGMKADFQEGFAYEDNDTIDDYDLIVYATYIGFHAPQGAQFFFGKECMSLYNMMVKGVEKSVGVSFGCTDIYYNYFTACYTFVNCYSYTEEAIRGFVKGLFGDLKFIDYNPYPLNPLTRNNEVY